MQPKKRFISLVKTGTRLVILAAILIMALMSNASGVTAAPALSLNTVTVGSQTGTLTAGTGGTVTFDVSVSRNGNNPGSFNLDVTGLPAGVSVSSQTPPNPVSFSSNSQSVSLEIQTDSSVVTGLYNFTVTATGIGNGSGQPQSGTGTLSIQDIVVQAPTDQTITFDPLVGKTFGDADFTVSATASSGLTVTFSAADNCTVTGDLVHLTGAGSCTITASQAGDANYNPAPDVAQTFAIAQADQTITFDPLMDKTFGDADFTVSATASSGLTVTFAAGVGDNCTVTGDLVHLTGAGSCTITASQVGDANYNPAPDVAQTFAIAPADQTITFDPLMDKTSGDPDFTVSATASSGLTVTFSAADNCTVTGDLVHLTGVGSCTITASQAGDANYNPAPDVAQTFAIAQAQADLAVTKTVDNPAPFDGENIIYTIMVTNNGPDNAANVSVTDLLPAGLTYVSDDGAGAYTGGVWTIGSLANGGTATLNITATVDPNTDGDTVTNSAIVASNVIELDPLNNAASVDLTVRVNDLCATTGTVTLPGSASTTIWGYTPGDCTRGLPVQLPGPTIIANQGETVNLTLHNGLSEATALLFQGQDMIPDTVGVASGADNAGNPYTFVASRPGTYLYEAGLLDNAEHQVAMGLYGALIVRPSTAGQAYDSASTAFDDEAVLVLSDIDPAVNNSTDPSTFDMRKYAPKYFLINGKVYPNTDPIPVVAGSQVLLRYVNAGLQAYSMSLLGLQQTAIAMDGSPFLYGRTLVAETIAPGQTADMLTSISAAAADGTKFALFDGNLYLHNNKANNASGDLGGMLTFLTVTSTPPTGDDTIGPATSVVNLTATSVGATVSDAGRGDSDVTAAEYFIDTTGTNGSGTPMYTTLPSTFDPGVTVIVMATIDPALSGDHTVYVHGMDSVGNWGAFQSAVIGVDNTGPTTSGLGLSPNPSNGLVNVALSATANDTASGGSNITAAEYVIDGICTVSPDCSMTVSPSGAQIASLSATIPADTVNALSDATHVVSVHSQDSMGNWGAPATIDLVKGTSGPVTSNVNAAPNPNNGTLGFNSSTPAVRVTALFVDLSSNISAAEAFIDNVGANGAGFILLPSDGSFNSLSENGYVDIPLATIGALSDGPHTISVHAKNAAGNWGSPSTTILVIDKTAPTISNFTLTSNTIALGTASVTLNVTASDGTGTGLNGGQYWIDGSATPPANATAFTGASATIDTSALAGGSHTVYVRMKDMVGNWSAVSNTTLYVVQAVDDTWTITANTSSTPQTSDANAAAGVLANDQPVGLAGRTASLASAPVRTSGNGDGTITVTCPASLGTGATPAISGNTICTNGAYRVTLTPISSNSGNQRRNSKRGTYQFTYTETLNGVTSTATVTITVN